MPAKLSTSHEARDADRTLSVSEMVLLSTAEAADWTTSPVRYEEIVIQAWTAFPERFSLQGHPEFPDASNIHKRLYMTLKQGDLIESLGNKTFRITDLGLSQAKSLMFEIAQPFPPRRVIQIEVQPNQTTPYTLKTLIDAAGPNEKPVAEQLVRAALSVRFPKVDADLELSAADVSPSIRLGGTTFTVLIPASVEDISEWAESLSSADRRRLLVRDSVLAPVKGVLHNLESSIQGAVYGVETFIGQMIDGMGQFDEQQIVLTLQSVLVAYNQKMPAGLPRLRLDIKEQVSK